RFHLSALRGASPGRGGLTTRCSGLATLAAELDIVRRRNRMRRGTVAWLMAATVGAALTITTGALAHFGLGTLAAVIGSPAVIWSNAAYALCLYPLTNGLLANPVGLFCFATPGQRLLSHLISAFLPFSLVARLVVAALAWRHARLLSKQTAA